MIIGHFSWLVMTYHHGVSLYKAIHRIQKEQIKGHKQYMRMNLVHNTIHVTVLKLLFPTEVESVTQSDIPNDMTSNQVKDTQHKCRVLCYWCWWHLYSFQIWWCLITRPTPGQCPSFEPPPPPSLPQTRTWVPGTMFLNGRFYAQFSQSVVSHHQWFLIRQCLRSSNWRFSLVRWFIDHQKAQYPISWSQGTHMSESFHHLSRNWRKQKHKYKGSPDQCVFSAEPPTAFIADPMQLPSIRTFQIMNSLLVSG